MPGDIVAEAWRDIPGFPYYQASDYGGVRSLLKYGKYGTPSTRWFYLKPKRIDRYGHLGVCLRRGGRSFYRQVHHLVLEAFVGPRAAGMECRHLDGNASNNRLDNLAWGTKAENEADKIGHGTRLMGSRVGNSVLTEADAAIALEMRSNGAMLKEIAARLGVSPKIIQRLCSGQAWKHVRGDFVYRRHRPRNGVIPN